MDNGTSIIELINAEGESIFLDHQMTLTYKDNDYVILSEPTQEDEGELEIIILRLEIDDDGNEVYVGIEDQDELDEIFMAYDEILNSDIYEQ
ncbi:MAG: DUF1292 domain-containing protein [Clostridiales bacterium]|nr:DUF1292 domain-containing protein [Clostridiales bacterium]